MNIQENANIDRFMDEIIRVFPEISNFKDILQNHIEKSNIPDIFFKPIRGGAEGMSLIDKVILSTDILKYPLSSFLFTLFHEIAHSYQYKKYGAKIMYQVYIGDIELKEAAKWMKDAEMVADEFATRKLREFINKGYLPKETKARTGPYKNIPLSYFESFINQARVVMRQNNINDPEKVSDVLYSWLRQQLGF